MAVKKQTLLDPEMVPNEPNHTRKSKKSYIPWVLVVLVILGAAGFVYNQQRKSDKLAQELQEIKNNPQKITEEESKVLLDKISALIEIPNEQPTIATVTDLAPLKDQPFFASAQVGDKVLIFSNAKKAYLYRPSTNKVIEVAPVDLGNEQAVNANTNTKDRSSTNSNSNSSSNSNGNSNKNTNSSEDLE